MGGRALLRLTIPLAEPGPCDGHRAIMGRKEEGAGQGNREQGLVTQQNRTRQVLQFCLTLP